jgi:hypothetical protein
MAEFFIQLRNVEKPVAITADKAQEIYGRLVLMNNADADDPDAEEENIGEFHMSDVSGWWKVEPPAETLPKKRGERLG